MTAADPVAALKAAFPEPSRADWDKLVEKTLKGASAEPLKTPTPDGFVLEPLYRPGEIEAVSISRPVFEAERPWDVRVGIAEPDPAQANARLLEHLDGGAASAVITLGEGGVTIGDAAAMARLLDGVMLELAAVAVDAGFRGPQAADWLAQAGKRAPRAKLNFHLDPIGAFAVSGKSPGPLGDHLTLAASTAARHADTYPDAGLFLANGRFAHEAGGTDATELAVGIAAALTYAKALVATGLPMDRAFKGVILGVSVESQYFAGIAKVRAARLLWNRLTAACGVNLPARIEARSSRRMLAMADAWTNLLRLTAAGFAGAVGGADAVMLDPFTQPLGAPADLARRQARNIQLVLMEESHLGKVDDPARGAGFIDTYTTELAKAAWALFQDIERQGGLAEALKSGLIAGKVEAARSEREAAYADKSAKILGVTLYPNANDTTPPLAGDILPAKGALPDPRLPGADDQCPALTPVRWSEPFEGAQ